MNRSIRSGGGPLTHHGRDLAERLPPLVARLRGTEIDQLARVLETERPSDILDLAFQFREARSYDEQRWTRLSTALEGAPDDRSRRRLVEHHLRQAGSGMNLWRDLAAMRRRWMDGDAILERIQERIEAAGVQIEILFWLLDGMALTMPLARRLYSFLDDPRLPTRRCAFRVLTRWLSREIQSQAPDSEASALVADLLSHPAGQDSLCGRQLVQLRLALPPEEARKQLRQGLQRPGAPDFLVRAEIARLSQAGDSKLQEMGWQLGTLDPSETVRCALALGLAERNDAQGWRLLSRLARADGDRAVRRQARLLLERRVDVDRSQPVSSTPAMPLERIADQLSELEPGQSETVPLPPGTTPVALAHALRTRATTGHGFALVPSKDSVVVHRGKEEALRLWRILHESRRPGPAKRHLGSHLLGKVNQGPIVVPASRLAETSPSGVPSRAQVEPALDGWGPWLPLPEDYLDAANWGSLVVVTSQGMTTLRAPEGVVARIRAQLSLGWQMDALSSARTEALRAKDPKGRGAYAARLAELGFHTDFEPQVQEGLPLKGVGQYFPSMADPFLLTLAAQRNDATDLAWVVGILGAMHFGRNAWIHRSVRNARASLPLVMGTWGTRGKSESVRLQGALFEGLGYPVFSKTTGSEACVLLNGPGLRTQVMPLFRPQGKVSIWEHARCLQLAGRRSRVFAWECMAVRPDYAEHLQRQWSRDDLSLVTNTHPDHADSQGPDGEDVAHSIASFLPENAPTLTTERQMLPILQHHAQQRGGVLLPVAPLAAECLPTDLLARFPHAIHPENLALFGHLAKTLGLAPIDAMILAGDHLIPDLGSLTHLPPLRLAGRNLELVNGMSANQQPSLLSNWRRSGFYDHNPQARPDRFYCTIVNNRRDRPTRSRAFARLLVRDIAAHRHIIMGTHVDPFMRQVHLELDQYLQTLHIDGTSKLAMDRSLQKFRRALSVVSPGPLIRITATRLGLDPKLAVEVSHALDSIVAHPPEEPLGLGEALELLDPLSGRLHALAQTAQGDLFHDRQDRQVATDQLPTQWMQVASEALAFSSLVRFCSQEPDEDHRDAQLRRLYRTIFLSHLFPIRDPEVSPDRVLENLVLQAPAGVRLHAMAIQNIGGPGQALARSFRSIQSLVAGHQELHHDTLGRRRAALETIAAHEDWCIPAAHESLRAIYAMKPAPELAESRDRAVAHVERELEILRQRLLLGSGRSRLALSVARMLQALWLPFSCVLRRRREDRVWADLGAGRISHPRAAAELEQICRVR